MCWEAAAGVAAGSVGETTAPETERSGVPVVRAPAWIRLRMCTACGKTGSCHSSPNRHARRHAADAHHPIIRSARPAEDWGWCFVDQVMVPVGEE